MINASGINSFDLSVIRLQIEKLNKIRGLLKTKFFEQIEMLKEILPATLINAYELGQFFAKSRLCTFLMNPNHLLNLLQGDLLWFWNAPQ